MFNAIDSNGLPMPEPDWTSIFHDELEIAAAREKWRVITIELSERGLLAASNGPAIERLILTYIVYDRCAREVAEHGSVLRARKTNSKAIARINPHFTAMTDAGRHAARLEADLGISITTRKNVTQLQRKANRKRASDEFLRPIQGGKA